MKPVKSKYSVFKLLTGYNDVVMTLYKISDFTPPPPPELDPKEEEQRFVNIAHPLPTTDDERVVDNYVHAIKKIAPMLYEQLQQPRSSSGDYAVGPTHEHLTSFDIVVSWEQYRALGSPSLDDVIDVTLQVSKRTKSK